MRRTFAVFCLALAAATHSAVASDAAAQLFVRGQVLSTGDGFVVFTSGDALRAAPNLVVPESVTLGTYVRAIFDPKCLCVVAIEREPRTIVTGEIDIAEVPRAFVATSPGSVAPAPRVLANTGAGANVETTVTIDVRVPANTPTSDDVYLATDRSAYSAAEIRMQRVDARTFRVSISLPGATRLRYTFTRGTNASLEREQTGGIAEPHTLIATPGLVTHDAVARWADIV